MENATRALIMAATMLLGVMLLGLLVWVFRAGGRLGQSYDLRQYRNSLAYFNSKLFAYDKVIRIDNDTINDNNLNHGHAGDYRYSPNIFTSEGNTISDVVSAVNLVYDYNKQFNYDNLNYCEIYICDANGNMQYYFPETKDLPQNTIYDKNNNIISLNELFRLHVEDSGSNAKLTKDAESASHTAYPSIKEMKTLSSGINFYRYYFETVTHVNDKTQRIDRMAFILVEMTGSDQEIKLHGSIKPSIDNSFIPYDVHTLPY